MNVKHSFFFKLNMAIEFEELYIHQVKTVVFCEWCINVTSAEHRKIVSTLELIVVAVNLRTNNGETYS